MIGKTLSHYRIGRRLGAGGMGEVFLAHDLALGRAVAVKVLASTLTDAARARLFREAQACARLQHPAIATFFESGESEGVAYLAMEFVKGETLRDRLRRGALPFPQALSVTASLLEALVHAHAAGVLHRDIKPENIMITGDHLGKLLDFGIAQLHEEEQVGSEEKTEVALTEAGAVIGTLGYMSPEQLRGKPLDERSDLFSLGAVFYEAIAGRPAFPGDNPAERIAANLSAEFEPLGTAGVPADAAVVLARAMARDPERRYPSAAAFLAELRALGSGELLASLPDTLAILDFRNLSRNPDDDWIGSGFAESLAVDLSRLPGVSLVPRDAVRRAAAEAGEQGRPLGQVLGCRWVLSGAYQRAGQHLRVTSQLSDGITGDTVASEKVDGEVDEMFSMQDRLSAAAAERLRPGAAPVVRPAPRIDVYERYERGRRFFHRLEKGSLDQAQALFEEAVAADAAYAPALAGLVAVHCMRFPYQTDPRELEIAESYARRAIAADGTLAEPRIWLGYALARTGRTEEASEQERRAMELDPASVYAPYFGGIWLAQAARDEEALALFQRTVALDPLHGFAWLALGWTHLELAHAAEAPWCLEKAVGLEGQTGKGPTAGVACYLGEALRRLGDFDRARSRCLEGLAAVERSDFMYRDTFRGVGLCALGRTALEQQDGSAADAAFAQAVAHLRGRPRSLGGGHLLVQALAGLARAGSGDAPYEQAQSLWRSRAGHDFSFMWVCTDDVTLRELGRAAAAIGRPAEAADLFEQARAAAPRRAPAREARLG